ncbi:MAG: hypothetical protein V1716_02430 [Candidatus Uhrbacteria bacterium]
MSSKSINFEPEEVQMFFREKRKQILAEVATSIFLTVLVGYVIAVGVLKNKKSQ